MRRATFISAAALGVAVVAAKVFLRRRAAKRARAALKSCRFRSWPITETTALEPSLRAMGLKVAASQIDGTGTGVGGCLSDALVSVGPAGHGGTGSFVSADGLIITNHHVAHDAVRRASTPDNDLLRDGFVARSRADEVRAPGYEVWITTACDDVSAEVLAAVDGVADPLARANAVRDAKEAIARAREAAAADAGLRCKVQEMWALKTYTLFTQRRIRDVRLVYVPPLCLGAFGGDADNFEWPRHTADFALLRAYVAPDGAAAEPDDANVAYAPSRHLPIAREGAAEGDFVFLLGFPGSTMRYAPACRLAFSDEVAVPSLIDDFAAKIELIDEFTADGDRAAALKLASARKSLANEHKRSSGKRVMMRRLDLLRERRAEEAKLCEAAPEAAALLSRLADVYSALRDAEPKAAALEGLRGVYHGSSLLSVAHALHEGAYEAVKPDDEREAAYRARNLPFLAARLVKRLGDLHPPHEAALVRRAASAPQYAQCAPVRALDAAADLLAKGRAVPTATLGAEEISNILHGKALPPDDPFGRCAAAVFADYRERRDAERALLSERDELLAKLLELQRTHASANEKFYPDANGCLRLSAGHVEGYAAADAVSHAPLTTVGGLAEKAAAAAAAAAKGRGGDAADGGGATGGAGEYSAPARLLALCEAAPRAVGSIPVNLLYSTDTVGGNSGSPVLDADGRFVAINFDRQRQGLMNEYKWSHAYSRSIGVDVRYVLWLVGSYDGATHLVEELCAA